MPPSFAKDAQGCHFYSAEGCHFYPALTLKCSDRLEKTLSVPDRNDTINDSRGCVEPSA